MAKILVIDPDKGFLNRIQAYLTELGYSVVTSHNGAKGVQQAIQYKPDLILSDTNPEELSGQEVFNIIQQVNLTSVIPFVFLTTKNSYEDLRAVMNLGIDDFLVKPFQLEELKQLIAIRLDKQKKLLEKTEKRFNYLIDYANTAICIYCEKQMEYVNYKFCEILGYSKSELVGMNIVNLIFKDDIHHVIDKINRCFRNIQTEMELVFRAIRKNREIVQLHFDARLVEFEGTKHLVGSIWKKKEETLIIGSKRKNRSEIELTTREMDVLHFICEGKTNQEISEALNLSSRTVEGHRYRLLKKTGCKNSVCLTVYAIGHDLYRI